VEGGGGALSTSIEQIPDLASRIESGDRMAESELIKRFGNGLRLILLKRTGSAQLASDLCQDTFVVALRKLRAGELKNSNALAAFVRQIAVNISIEHFRKEKRFVCQDDEMISRFHSHKDKNAKSIDDQTVKMAIGGALELLRVERDREILRRFYLDDQDKEKICAELRLSISHFDRVLYRARQRMRELINQNPRLKELLIGAVYDA
jgi:RNA polymerase sigma-70 factor (ECF subfamily)